VGRDNPTNIKTVQCFEEAPELIHQRLVDQDDAFHRAMAAAPEGQDQPNYVQKQPGTDNPHTVCRPVTTVIRSSSGW
jgi:hypothetical protein